MKKVLLVMAAAVLFTATPSCKKGENDPFLSLKSRKSRLAGEYDLASWMMSVSATDSDGDKQTFNTSINGSTGTTVYTYTPEGEGTATSTRNIVVNNALFTIDKDGTWSFTFNTTTTWTEEGDGWIVEDYDYTEVATSTESGSWSFVGGQAEEFKNKERVLFSSLTASSSSQTTTTTNYEDGSSDTDEGDLYDYTDGLAEGSSPMIYEIDMLKSKEITLIQDLSSSSASATTIGAITFNYSVVSVGNAEMNLTAK